MAGNDYIDAINKSLCLTDRYGIGAQAVTCEEAAIINMMMLGLVWEKCFKGKLQDMPEAFDLGKKNLQEMRNGIGKLMPKSAQRAADIVGVHPEVFTGKRGIIFEKENIDLLVKYRRLVFIKKYPKRMAASKLLDRLYYVPTTNMSKPAKDEVIGDERAKKLNSKEAKKQQEDAKSQIDTEIKNIEDRIILILKRHYDDPDLLTRAESGEVFAKLLAFIKYRGETVGDEERMRNLIMNIHNWDVERLSRLDEVTIKKYVAELDYQRVAIQFIRAQRRRAEQDSKE